MGKKANIIPVLDIIPLLEGIVAENTRTHQTDLAFDIKRLNAAMLDPVPENRIFLWMCRPCGTWCFWEREVFLRDTEAHITWTHSDYIAQASRIKAYRITVEPGQPGNFVLGEIQPLNYGEQVKRVKRLALPICQVKLTFESGETRILTRTDYDNQFHSIFSGSKKIECINYQPENEGELSALLFAERHPPKQQPRRPKKPAIR